MVGGVGEFYILILWDYLRFNFYDFFLSIKWKCVIVIFYGMKFREGGNMIFDELIS